MTISCSLGVRKFSTDVFPKKYLHNCFLRVGQRYIQRDTLKGGKGDIIFMHAFILTGLKLINGCKMIRSTNTEMYKHVDLQLHC